MLESAQLGYTGATISSAMACWRDQSYNDMAPSWVLGEGRAVVMAEKKAQTFIIDCPICKAKVAANQTGLAKRKGFYDGPDIPFGQIVRVGTCPQCKTILVGETDQIRFKGHDAYEDRWSDVVRVYPSPPKTFSSHQIPDTVTASLDDANRSLQAGANMAACTMLGRALEALCRDKSGTTEDITLYAGLEKLKKDGIIDDRLHAWGKGIKVFRDDAAHPDPKAITRQDAEDAQTFVYAIVEYVYDLTELYDDFKKRVDARKKLKKP